MPAMDYMARNKKINDIPRSRFSLPNYLQYLQSCTVKQSKDNMEKTNKI